MSKPNVHPAHHFVIGNKLHGAATEIARQIGGEYERRDDETAVGKTLRDQVGLTGRADRHAHPRQLG